MNRIDPDKDAVDRQQFVADGIGEGFVVDDGAALDADSGERFEDADEAAVLRRRVPARGRVTTGKNRNGLTERGARGVHA